MEWEKGHGQLVRRRLKSIELSPEQSGLCGCWRMATVERATIDLKRAGSRPETEIAYYVTSRTKEEMSDAKLLEAIVGHWAGIENGTHRVRDVTFGAPASQSAMITVHLRADQVLAAKSDEMPLR